MSIIDATTNDVEALVKEDDASTCRTSQGLLGDLEAAPERLDLTER